MRKNWLDNLRSFTVLLVLLYHVFFFFNNKGVFGGVGGFCTDPAGQPQDLVMYILYPWFMMLLFLLAGISARYSLEKRSAKEFACSRTLKLLVPATVGLFVYQWIVGYFNTRVAAAMDPSFNAMPKVIKWGVFAVSGCGPLWFAQELWLFSMLLLLVRKMDSRDKFYHLCAKASTGSIVIVMGVLVYLGSQFMIMNPRLESADGLYNLYRPMAYLLPFLMGYFVFSNESVLLRVKAMTVPMSGCALVAGVALCVTHWGQDITSPQYLSGWLNCLYAWLMILAMMGIFMRWMDGTNRFWNYLGRSSYGLYVLHYSVLVSFGYMLKNYTELSPWVIYPVMIVLVFSLTPALFELLRRTPFLRWSILGVKKNK